MTIIVDTILVCLRGIIFLRDLMGALYLHEIAIKILMTS